MTETNMKCLKMATWNIGGGITGDSHQTDGSPDLESYAETLLKHRPNLICLQESHHYLGDNTNQANELAKLMGYKYSSSTPISASHLEPHARLALGLISEFPIVNTKYTKFHNPGLTSIGPRGEEWKLFDKGYCTHTIEIGNREISVLNAHCFPLHYFSSQATEERFSHIWENLANGLAAARQDTPCVAAIDLNYDDIETLLGAELTPNRYTSAINKAPTTPKGIQQDYLLYTPGFRLLTKSVIPTKSDHHLCIIQIEIQH